ncbi:single-stranded DNA-binding protein [Microbacterium sp. YY-01]|uniref:single-stranded DNA-binding protein n=1 Tax=Microbacterium sp. YY-01 TaxID=3421634 RepID=UPI003D1668D3
MSVKTIVGRLGRAPEVRATSSGKQVVSFSVAETKRKFDRDRNEWVDDFTIWHDMESWRNVNAIAALGQGALVIVHGEERDASYTHRETGNTVRRMVVRAETVGEVVKDTHNGGQQATGDSWATSNSHEAPEPQEAGFETWGSDTPW